MAIIRKDKKNIEAVSKAILGHLDSPSALLEFAVQNGVTTNPLDVFQLANELSIEVERRPLRNDVSGYLMGEDGRWTITVNSLHHPNRQRFTVAHELAHYCLHRDNQTEFVDTLLFRNDDVNPMERAANSFAGELLVPEDQLKDLVKNGITRVEDLARVFEVSSLALRVRARQIGMTGHGL